MMFEHLLHGDKTEAHREEFYIYDHCAIWPGIAPELYSDYGIVVSYNYVIGGASLMLCGDKLVPCLMDDGRVTLVLPNDGSEH